MPGSTPRREGALSAGGHSPLVRAPPHAKIFRAHRPRSGSRCAPSRPTAGAAALSATPLDAIPNGVHHPISVVVVPTRDFEVARRFYTTAFGWHMHHLTESVAVSFMPTGPSVVLRSRDAGDETPTTPLLQVADVNQALADVVARGGAQVAAPYDVPLGGRIVRFADPSGTVYGLTSNIPAGAVPQVPIPVGANPRPADGTVCSVEMYTSDPNATAHFFGSVFAWRSIPTLPHSTAFDPGAGIAGIWQSHTPSTRSLPYIYAASVEQALRDVERAGGVRRGTPTVVPGMATFGYFTDPSGTPMGMMGG